MSFIIDCFADAHTPLNERQKGTLLFVTFSFHEIGGWNHCVLRWERGEGGWRKKWMELDGDSLKWGESREEVLSGCRTVHDFARNYQRVRTRKIITPVEQIKFLTNALWTPSLYIALLTQFLAFESLWISNEFIWFWQGRGKLLESSLTSRRNSLWELVQFWNWNVFFLPRKYRNSINL